MLTVHLAKSECNRHTSKVKFSLGLGAVSYILSLRVSRQWESEVQHWRKSIREWNGVNFCCKGGMNELSMSHMFEEWWIEAESNWCLGSVFVQVVGICFRGFGGVFQSRVAQTFRRLHKS